jgi:glucan 1,3-beta-glucosidase
LYQYNYHNASNVFSALQQSETAIWQGVTAGMGELDPAPWQSNLVANEDPTFNSCANATDTACRLGWFEIIRNSRNLFLYSQSDLAYIANGAPFGPCSASNSGPCEKNAIDVTNSSAIYMFGINLHKFVNMITENDGANVVVTEAGNVGGVGSSLAAYINP